MSFERAVTAGLTLGYGYIARETYRTYRDIQGTSMVSGALRSGNTLAPANLVTPNAGDKRGIDEVYRTPSTFAPSSAYTPRILGPMRQSATTRTRRSRYRHNIGERPRYQCLKHSFKTTQSAADQDKTRYKIRLIKIPWSDADEVFNRRKGRLVNVRGIRFQWICKWKDGQATNEPIQVRWAVLNPKQNSGDPNDIDTTNWWRSLDPGNEYAEDYTTSADHFDLSTRAINRKKYGVLKEGTFTLGPAETNANDGRTQAKQQRMVQFYLPINQQVKWGANDATEAASFPNANIHFVYWYWKRGTLELTQSFTSEANTPIETRAQITNFFRNANALT